jgi:hypothetical protein
MSAVSAAGVVVSAGVGVSIAGSADFCAGACCCAYKTPELAISTTNNHRSAVRLTNWDVGLFGITGNPESKVIAAGGAVVPEGESQFR